MVSEYKLKPIPTISRGAKSAQKKQEIAEQDKTEKSAQKATHDATRAKMHTEMVSTIKTQAELSELNANGVIEALSKLKQEVSGIELEIPEYPDGNNIAQSIGESAKTIEKSLETIVSGLKKISLEIPEQLDISPSIEGLSKVIKNNLSVLQKSIGELNKSIEGIELEAYPPPIGWEFTVDRNEKGFISKITANATDYMSFTDE